MTNEFKFTDKKGREWDTELDLAAANRIDGSDFKEVTDEEFSFLRPNKRMFMLLLEDDNLLFAIIWAVVQPQVSSVMDIDPTESEDSYENAQAEFISGLNGRAIQEGRDAFWKSIADFFQEHQTVLSNLMRQYKNARSRVAEKMVGMDKELEQLINREVDEGMERLRNKMREGMSIQEQ